MGACRVVFCICLTIGIVLPSHSLTGRRGSDTVPLCLHAKYVLTCVGLPRQEELRDPDFRRAHAGYGQRFDPGFGEDPADQGGQYMRPTYSNHVRIQSLRLS